MMGLEENCRRWHASLLQNMLSHCFYMARCLQSFNTTNCAKPNMMKIASLLFTTQASKTNTVVDFGSKSRDSLESHVAINFQQSSNKLVQIRPRVLIHIMTTLSLLKECQIHANCMCVDDWMIRVCVFVGLCDRVRLVIGKWTRNLASSSVGLSLLKRLLQAWTQKSRCDGHLELFCSQ